jgi:transcriptional regulator with XRE-family HTH domain
MGKKLIGMNWLRFQMKRNGYTSLEQVAQAADLNRGNLWRYFNLLTRPSIDVLPRLAYALDVEMLEVLAALNVKAY